MLNPQQESVQDQVQEEVTRVIKVALPTPQQQHSPAQLLDNSEASTSSSEASHDSNSDAENIVVVADEQAQPPANSHQMATRAKTGVRKT